jgi:hypothetical protein
MDLANSSMPEEDFELTFPVSDLSKTIRPKTDHEGVEE